jgi:1-acyl-sn-glycerol-3-phosphate acyltransferase
MPSGDGAVRRRPKEWIARWRFAKAVAEPIVQGVAPLRIRGLENIPASGPFILTPNHITDFDPLVMGTVMLKADRVPRFLAKASLFKVPVLGNALRWLGQIPVERASKRGPDPLRAARMLIDNGWAVIIYPEGTLTREPDLWPMRGKSGAVRAALDSGIPIVPAAHWGAQAVMPRWSKRVRIFPRHPVDVVIGEPFDLSPWKDAPRDAATYTAATEALMTEITRLLEGLRGETAPAGRWDPTEHGQTEFGRP